jgi:diguanylate cyclase (GGDEF)-like protein
MNMSKERRVRHPLHRNPAREPSGPPIYLVNSNALLAEDMAMKLRHFGHAVVVIDAIAKLAAAISERMPAAVILDFDYREDIFGKIAEIAQHRRADNQRFPMMLISTRGSFKARLAAARAGADCYFTRPTDMVALKDRLDALVLSKETHPYRILLISDDAAASEYCAGALREAGMDVRLLRQPTDIFREFDEYHPELAVMDVSVPSCTGLDLTRLIRQNNVYLDVPIVFLSNDSSLSTRLDAIQSGAEDFLVKPIEARCLVSSLSSRAERYRALRGLIMRDSLTGLFNHSAIKEYLARSISSTDRAHAPLALAMIDLDFFKRINDSYGHPVGDQVIRALSRLLQQRLRRGDVIGRYGGEEFAVILPATTSASAVNVIDEVREAFSKIRHQADECEFTATFSAGVADIVGHADADALFRAADSALYKAKHNGRNRIEMA